MLIAFFVMTEQSLMKAQSRLQHTADPSLADSPSRKFTSALNTHTSVLNTADESVGGSPLQMQGHSVVGDEPRGEVPDSRKGGWSSDEESSDGSSASDHESESGSAGSSSEGEREVKMHQGGGKTLPGELQHNKHNHRKVLLKSFHCLNGHTYRFHPQTQELEPPCMIYRSSQIVCLFDLIIFFEGEDQRFAASDEPQDTQPMDHQGITSPWKLIELFFFISKKNIYKII